MRRLGLGLMIAGLIAALVATALSELGSAASERAAHYLDVMFYAGAAMCLAGAAAFVIRVLIARRRLG